MSNESAEILRMFNVAFDDVDAVPGDYYPQPLRPEIDALNARIYDTLNNGVNRAGFATTQQAYDEGAEAEPGGGILNRCLEILRQPAGGCG